jgi:hypothetical protein
MKILRIGLFVFFAQLLAAQQPTAASLQGVVVRFGSEKPVGGATVELRTDSGVSVGTRTDGDGRFIFPSVRPGSYRLIGARPGYVRTEYGQKSAGAPAKPLVVGAGERLTELRLVLMPGGVITGRVMDRGRPATNVRVAAGMTAYAPDGQRVWNLVLSGETSDLGEYSIFWLPAGRYYVMADETSQEGVPPPQVVMNPGGGDNPLISRGVDSLISMLRPVSGSLGPIFSRPLPSVGDSEMHVPTFFPRTPEWKGATPIEITPGAEVRNVDIDISPVPALHVRGIVTGSPANAQGQPVRPQIRLFEADSLSGIVVGTIQGDPAGNFDLPRIQRGSYLLVASAGNVMGSAAVDVLDRDVNGVTVALGPRFAVSGRIALEPPGMGQGNLTVEVRDERGARTSARPTADGSFTIPNLAPGESYRVFVSPVFPVLGVGQGLRQTPTAGSVPRAFRVPSLTNTALQTPPTIPPEIQSAYVKSIMMGSEDVLNNGLRLTEPPRSPLVITIGANAGSLEGRVVSSQQSRQPVAAATVVLIPENGQRFHVNHKFTVTDEAGRFRILSVPPGDYKLFAWESIEPGAWQNEDFVGGYESQGKLVRIEEGGKHSVELTSIP